MKNRYTVVQAAVHSRKATFIQMKHFYRYLPVGEEVRRQSLFVVSGGYTLIPPHTPYPPLNHPDDHDLRWTQGRTLQEYQVIYITRGGGVFQSRLGGSAQIKAGMLFMLFPGEWHRYSPDLETGWDEYWIGFQGKRAAELVAEYPLTTAQPVLNIGHSERLVEEFSRIFQEMRDEQVGYQKVIAAGALQVLAVAMAASLRQNFAGTEIARVVEAAKANLRERVHEPVNVEELAVELGVGYCWFRRAFREYTGISPAQYHLQLRIHHASELLRTTTLTVEAIGQRSGFESDNYFFRIFKKKMGYTPGAYRSMTNTDR
ncbi:transcriptional regulator [Capsulimonas corticalis]|uniref:Transcriptional regulator n=1 Tax=Capsulimonas corticalis TaxID=2219043 RepID=A0A402D2X3_9BACT|nr:AraC family transcriptional regulator [Capsulimonas corticalis]BDI28379.1 transcriptional regulator [Capsulimonas corticalis]